LDLPPTPDLASLADVDLAPPIPDGRLPDLSPLPGPGLLPDSPVSKCGNGVVDPDEECDDGNTRSNDGCSSSCKIDCYWMDCWPNPRPVRVCGNGVVDPGEECDDGNLVRGDGCSPACTVELGFHCPLPGWPCVSICGDLLTVGGETCDDGNTTSGDGCSSVCQVEPGWYCAGSVCRRLSSLDAGSVDSGTLDGHAHLVDASSD
jgi:cysteine-rich repeat protein